MNEIISPQIVAQEAALRRTFAIISHPDAGKTTLTEKLLLYSGMTRTAGMVRARKGAKQTTSDWMALEQERGISITASAMQFRYKDAVVNLLDTPGHQDFSEDTYRTLTAADSAVMVIDASKGVEAQTRKLFAVCHLRGIPVLTLVNKMDLPARDPLDLMHEVEQVLGIHAAPVTWPIGSGKEFVGVVSIETKEVLLFEKSAQGGALKAETEKMSLDELEKSGRAPQELTQKLKEDLELLEVAGNAFSKELFLQGKITPVFFGSALTNFGIEPFFDTLVTLAPAPAQVSATDAKGDLLTIEPSQPEFSAFIFKIQSNMNPRHRDSMAFARVCSGRFERDMVVKHSRLGKDLRLSRSYSMVARERDTVDDAYPGDIIGFTNPGVFLLGDSISESGKINFKPLPQFAPELVARVRPNDVLKRKAFDKGVEQLSLEGTIHLLYPLDNRGGAQLIAAVGRLQFDVFQYRLEDEYGVKSELDQLPYRYCAFLEGSPEILQKTQSSMLVKDRHGHVLLLYEGEWEKGYIEKNNPQHRLTFMTS